MKFTPLSADLMKIAATQYPTMREFAKFLATLRQKMI